MTTPRLHVPKIRVAGPNAPRCDNKHTTVPHTKETNDDPDVDTDDFASSSDDEFADSSSDEDSQKQARRDDIVSVSKKTSRRVNN